jgi:3-oxoacyl-[acyl-carrier protein] reductase
MSPVEDAGALDQAGTPAPWALVAGATGGVGHVVADVLAAAGNNVVVHSGHRPAAAGDLAKELTRRYGVRAVAVRADVTDAGELGALRGELGRAGVDSLTTLVNCVTARSGVPAPASRVDAAEFRRVLDVDLVGSYMLVQELVPLLAAGGLSKIILLTPRVSPHGGPQAVHLSAAKAGVHELVSVLADELDEFGIRVHALAPGPIAVPGQGRPSGLRPGVAVSTAEEVARVVLDLVSVTNGGPVGQLFGADRRPDPDNGQNSNDERNGNG